MGRCLTTNPVEPGDFTEVMPEFGRTPDVEKYFGIKKGTLYNLLGQGKVHGVVIRTSGQTKGVRLWDLASIRGYIYSEMNQSAA